MVEGVDHHLHEQQHSWNAFGNNGLPGSVLSFLVQPRAALEHSHWLRSLLLDAVVLEAKAPHLLGRLVHRSGQP